MLRPFRGSRLRANKKANRRISNIEPQNIEGKNCCLFLKVKAKRFHPSIRRGGSASGGLIFEILRFCGSLLNA
jgi:hypothetical protein